MFTPKQIKTIKKVALLHLSECRSVLPYIRYDKKHGNKVLMNDGLKFFNEHLNAFKRYKTLYNLVRFGCCVSGCNLEVNI